MPMIRSDLSAASRAALAACYAALAIRVVVSSRPPAAAVPVTIPR
jgi:hypothetical protein